MNELKGKEKWMVIGYKFGIYGYLPALVNCGYQNIFIDLKGKSYISKITNLKHLENQIEWIKDNKYNEVIIDNIILAIPPYAQYEFTMSTMNINRVKNLILEKPLATNPKQAAKLVENLSNKNINYKVNYSFLYTNWYQRTKEKVLNLDLNTRLKISWGFKAHHFANNLNNWKRYHSKGGGAIRFYGIHLIAFLSSLGYEEVNNSSAFQYSEDEIYKWTCSISQNEYLPECSITLDTFSNNNFFNISYIKDGLEKNLLNIKQPFELETIINGYDQRVSLISKFIDDKRKINQKNIINLWKEIEEKLLVK